MRVQSVRFTPVQWQTIQRIAELEGMSASQFIRESAFVRAMILLVARNPDLRGLHEAVERLQDADPDLVEKLLLAVQTAGPALKSWGLASGQDDPS